MFKIDGNVDVTIVEAFIADSKFAPNAGEINNRNEYVQTYYDVCLVLQDKDANTDTWHGEISNRTGTGTMAHLYRSDLTLQTLQDIGFNVKSITDLEMQFQTQADRTITVPNIIGMKATATVAQSEKNGKTFYNVKYLNKLGGNSRKLTMEELIARRQQAAAPVAPQAQPQPQYTPTAPANAAPVYPAQGGVPPVQTGYPQQQNQQPQTYHAAPAQVAPQPTQASYIAPAQVAPQAQAQTQPAIQPQHYNPAIPAATPPPPGGVPPPQTTCPY